jgi:beta-ureidopropionase
MASEKEVESLEYLLDKAGNGGVSSEELAEMKRIIYGRPVEELTIPPEAVTLSEEKDFEIKAYRITTAPESTKKPRLVKLGLVQNKIVLPTTDPVEEQRDALHKRIVEITEAAACCNVNVLCYQEAWPCPFFFCTREKRPWCELAESASDGPTVKLCQELAKKYNMVIVCPILERDTTHNDILANTAGTDYIVKQGHL